MRVLVAAFAVLIAALLSMPPARAAAVQRRTDEAPRQRPPESFSCNPDNLTSFTGVVVGYTRQTGRTTLRIRTDWDTTEDVVLTHPGTDDPSAQFRFSGRPFTTADWARVERTKGVLNADMRASAWVCSDGKVMVDWGVVREGG